MCVLILTYYRNTRENSTNMADIANRRGERADEFDKTKNQ